MQVLAVPAFAGHYTVVYSGGVGSTPANTYPYQLGSNGWTGSASYSGNGAFADCSGQITATFTWVADYTGDVPPLSAIVYEQCTSGSASYYGTNTAADGFGDASTATYSYTQSTGVRWTVKNSPDTGFSITCSPSAHTSGSVYGLTASVQYAATAIAPKVGLSGVKVTPDHQNHILIGQGCVPHLETYGGVTIQNSSWSVGGDVFKSYEAHGHDTGAFAHVTLMNSFDWHQVSPLFFWKSENMDYGDPENVIGSADVYAIINGTSVKFGTVAAQAIVNVWAPYYFCDHIVGRELLYGNSNWNILLSAGGEFDGAGITWRGKATPPDFFELDGAGIWAFDQIIMPGRWYTGDNNIYYGLNINGLLGLDTSYPYAPDGGNFIIDDSNAGWPDGNLVGFGSDSPYSTLFDDMAFFHVNELFWTYMVYRPAEVGVGHQWVPLHRIAWNWSPSATRVGNSWTSTLFFTGKPVAVTEDQRCISHPVWNRVFYAEDSIWIP